MNTKTLFIHARDNPSLKRIRKIAQDNTGYREHGKCWLEGEHLCEAATNKGVPVEVAVFEESYWSIAPLRQKTTAAKNLVVTSAVFRSLSTLDSPARIGFLASIGNPTRLEPDRSTVILDRVQDAGNVGSILRSASAFGYTQILALRGTAGLWSPKVVRAGMGAHFSLHLLESCTLADVARLAIPILVTSSHQGLILGTSNLSLPPTAAWIFGCEGTGVSPELLSLADIQIRIPQPGGEESLNVAAAAAICLYAHRSAAILEQT